MHKNLLIFVITYINDMKDIKKLGLLYEECQSNITDFLLLDNVDNFNFNYFWDIYILNDQNNYPLYESFELIRSNETEDIYQIETTNKKIFTLNINYLNKTTLDNKLMGLYFIRPKDKIIINTIQTIVKNTKYPILNINFKDDNNNFNLTGNVGNYTFSVINGIRHAIIQSLNNRLLTNLPEVLYFYILKNEDRKLEFFKTVFRKIFTNYKYQYIDDSDSKYNLIYFY